jgi:phage replication O-like protein O
MVPNDVIESVAKAKLNGTQYAIVMVVWRYTYGFHREQHEISLTFLVKATGINKMQIQRELTKLIDRKILKVEREASFNSPKVIKFNESYQEWELPKQITVSENAVSTVSELVDSTVSESANQEINNKKNIKEREDRVPYKEIVDAYNSICLSMPRVRAATDNRKEHIRSRWKEHGQALEGFKELFRLAEESDFLTGRITPNGEHKNWRCDFDWLINQQNMAKVLEGKYKNKNVSSGPQIAPKGWTVM